MRICMLTYYYWPNPVGGSETQCRKLAATLVKQGYTCTVLTSRCHLAHPARQTELSGVQIVRKATLESLVRWVLGKQGEHNTEKEAVTDRKEDKSRPSFVEGLKSLMVLSLGYGNIIGFSLGVLFFLARNRRAFDLIHVHTAEWIAGLAVLVGKLFHLPVVCKVATLPAFPSQQAGFLEPLCTRLRKQAHFIALTQAMQESLLINGIAPTQIRKIPNGIHIPEEQSQPEQQQNFLYIANFSQSIQDKAFDILIEAWAFVHKQRPQGLLILVGGGDSRPYQTLSRSLGCGQSTEFVGYQNDLSPWYQGAGCFLLPSRNEGISNALLEAQSWGLPAIVSDIPGNCEVVLHEHNGLIVPVGNPQALAQAMIVLYDAPKLRRDYGLAARKRMESRFALDKVAEQTLALYASLLA
jgi:glycosyltransferase involved in cell wall biosynthesis